MKRLAVLVFVLFFAGFVSGAPVPVEDIELGFYDVPQDYYEYDYYPAGVIVNFDDVEMLRVLGPLNEDETGYYFVPGEGLGNGDYNGDIDVGSQSGFIQFNAAGPYFVELTRPGGAVEYEAFGVEFEPRVPCRSSRWKKAPTPSPDVVITDPDFADSNPDFPPRPPEPNTIEVNNCPDWPCIKNYIRGLKNAHVELGGHGKKGEFYWKGKRILDRYNARRELEDLKGHVKNLTFMACEVGADPNFVQEVADILGECSAYTTPVGGNGEEWFIADGGKKVTRYKRVDQEDCSMHADVAYVGAGADMLVVSGVDEDAGRVYNWAEVTLAEADMPGVPIGSVYLTDMELDDIDGRFSAVMNLGSPLAAGVDYVVSVQYDWQGPEEAYEQVVSFVGAAEEAQEVSSPDLDGSGCVDVLDFAIFANHWLTCVD